MDKQIIKIFCDGGSRGNPGPAGVGVVIIEPNKKEDHFKKFIGHKTNNQAEYEAVLLALEILGRDYPKNKEIEFYLDSELVVKQLKGEYKIKNEKLGELVKIINDEIRARGLITNFCHVRREKNYQADKLVNQAIDSYAQS